MLWFKKKEEPVVELNGNVVRWRIQFFGKVQNVGFRFTASQIAKSLGLTGWVRNEEDGSVTLEVQGESEKLDEVIYNLHQDKYIRIDDYKITPVPVKGHERQFTYHY